jgi:DNA-binding NarL/FixJ family response regulator
MKKTNINRRGAALVADDHSLYRVGLGFLLKDRLGFQSVVEASSFDAALDRLADTPDIEIALFDLSMPGVGGPHSLSIVETFTLTFGWLSFRGPKNARMY